MYTAMAWTDKSTLAIFFWHTIDCNKMFVILTIPFVIWVARYRYWHGFKLCPLGVKITSNLSWRSHILAKTTMANLTLNLLRRTMYSCGEGAKKRVYEALVRPQVKYCSPVWNPHLKKDVDVLEKLQRRAACWICCRWNKHTYKWSRTYSEAINHLGWKTLEDRRNNYSNMLPDLQNYPPSWLYPLWLLLFLRQTHRNPISCLIPIL